ncbi:hypothetical protein Cch01nite_21560 [Cellulomonas chitinilytica]|uniref:Uncharacterized protein n=1 Tax=Cellulomonas chitinilytica TaxID=398759 RepID=A0A919P1A5_9CELL|nr:hypothetical protein [Cellulomonas chitinilytica]GIG21432.1 hypothetical protein Cch01nite_21560 [Cellulomonas chitinilytica]
MHRQVGALILAGGLALAGCSPSSSEVAPTPDPSRSAVPIPGDVLAGLSVEVRQARSDWALRVVQLRVTNAGPGDVTVAQARLVTPDDEGVATGDRERPVRAGVDRDVSVALGTPDCTSATSGVPRAELDLVDPDGRRSTLVVQPDDPQGHLARIHGEDCAAAAVARGATITLADELGIQEVDGRFVAEVDLEVEPVPGGPRVELNGVDGTVLLAPADGATGWAVDVDTADGGTAGGTGGTSDGATGGESTTLRLLVVPTRCDAHAVAEDKRGTFFGLHTRVDGVEQPVFYVGADDSLRGALHDFVGTSCGVPAAS